MRHRLAIVSGILLLSDFVAGAAIYYSLPDTRKLLTSAPIERKDVNGLPQTVGIRPKSSRFVRIFELPKSLKYSIIQLEDSRFYEHRGFDLTELVKALWDFAVEGKRLRGASTISQQLVKNLYLSSHRTFFRKFVEALITMKLELHVPKERILEIYINGIDWGKNIVGISAAARHYFKVDARNLNVRQCAFLAAIIPNPSRFGPNPDRQFVKTQMLKAIERLYRAQVIDLDQYRESLVEEASEEFEEIPQISPSSP